jgi:hypothetical protein
MQLISITGNKFRKIMKQAIVIISILKCINETQKYEIRK